MAPTTHPCVPDASVGLPAPATGLDAPAESQAQTLAPVGEDALALVVPQALPRLPAAPSLSQAAAPLLRSLEVMDEHGQRRSIFIPQERPLTVFVDKRELVTLMSLGAWPEALVLGWLWNQRLVSALAEIDSISVDWDVGAAAVRTRGGLADMAQRTAHRVVTTGCGQGTVYGEFDREWDTLRLPSPEQARLHQRTLRAMLEQMRQRASVHRKAGSVHGCALFQGERMLIAVEDVGRHNAMDTIAGWMALHGVGGADKVFYTTGRLTSEMVMKSAQLGVPIVVSRNGVTAMGHELAERLGMALFGRAANRHFLCYCGFERFDAEPEAQPAAVRVVAG